MTINTPFAHLPREAQATKIDETAWRILNQEVHLNVSGLIGGLQRIIGDLTREQIEALGTDDDDMMTLAYMQPDADDYAESDEVWLESPQYDRVPIYEIEEGDDGFRWTETAAIQQDGEPLEKGDWQETALDAWKDLFDAQGFDAPAGKEVYEYWVVSSWLANKLREQGHTVVDDVAGMTVWGRPTTGQTIYMDGVMQKIARDMLEAE